MNRKLKDPEPPNDTGTHKKSDLFIDALHIFVLFSFALAQPLFDLLSRYPEFFVARKSEPIDIILFILTLCLFLPGMAVLLEAASGIFGRRFRKAVHWFMIATLVAVIALQVLKKIFQLPGLPLIIIAAILGVAATIAYVRLRPAKIFFTVLCPVILIFPGLFVFNSPIHKVVFPEKDPSAIDIKIDDPPPIIMVVFDEFPVTSLMDEDGKIDPIRYPNFADLAQDSYWFRNDTTVGENTHVAIPAILTGRYPEGFRLPNAAEYPETIFTLLGGTYELKVSEPVTQLCPLRLCGSDQPDVGDRMGALLMDLYIVYLHVILPTQLRTDLPDITKNWMAFGPAIVDPTGGNQAKKVELIVKQELKELTKNRARQFEEFVHSISPGEQPVLYFLHILLPHSPLIYLPSGKRYAVDSGLHGLISDKWGADESKVIKSYQRFLLQVGFMDLLIGKLVAHLKTVGLYDPSLIVITADHGVSFRPNDFRRPLTKTNYGDIAAVPLFIKEPNQRQGVISDCNVESIDILPTIADILDIHLPWKADGRSAIDHSQPEREKKIIYYNNAEKRFMFDSNFWTKYSGLKRKLDLFGSGARNYGLFKIGPHSELVGKHLNELILSGDSGVAVEFDQAGLYEQFDPESQFIPAQITGVIMPGNLGEEKWDLAIAVNGTIQAVTRSYSSDSGVQEFSAIVPESSFREGKNNVELFVVSKNGEMLCLERTRMRAVTTYSYVPSANGTSEIITTSSGESITVTPGALKGYIDIIDMRSDHVFLAGWAADIKNSQLPEAIVIFEGCQSVYAGRCNELRPDVAKAFGNNSALQGSGFKYLLPMPLFKDVSDPEVRVFAISKEGVACELYYPKGYKRGENGPSIPADPVTGGILWLTRNKTGSNATYSLSKSSEGDDKTSSLKGTSIPVASSALKGHLDIAKVENENVVFSGWAADIKNSQLPEAIIIFLNGRFFYSGKCNLDRPDVAKAYTNPALRKSGFKYAFPLSSFEDLADCEVRIFAVSQKGTASELIYPKGYKWGKK